MEDLERRDAVAAERGVVLLGAALILAIYAAAETVAEIHQWKKEKKE